MGKRYKHKKIKLATTDKDNIVGNITLESQQNRDYFYGVQQRLLDNRVEAQFRGLLMQGMLPKGHGKKEVMQTVQYQRFCELWKGDKHIRVDVIERKDLQQEDGSTKYFPVLFCNKMVKTTKRIFTVFGELKDSYEDAEALGEEIKKRTQLNWEGLGVMSKEEGGIKNEGGGGGNNGKLN